MKFLSSLTASLMLGAATIAVAAVPSAVAAKEQKSKAPKIKPSKGFIAPYKDGLAKIEAADATGIAAAGAAMKAAIEKPDDSYLLGNYYLSAGTKLNDPATTIEGLDLLIASELTPPENRQILYFQKGAQAFNGLKNYSLAAQSFEKAYELGLRRGNVDVNAANAYTLLNDHNNAIKWLKIAADAKIAAGEAVPDQYYRLMATNANKANNPVLLADTMQYIVTQKPTSDYWHDAVVLYLRAQDLNSQDKLDLLRLMRETDTLRYPQQYAEYVEMADARRYPAEVAAVLDEGFASGIIKKSDVAFSDSYSAAKGRITGIRSSWDRDETEAMGSSKGYLALLTGDAMLAGGDYARATKMYEAALQKGSIIDSSGKNQNDRAAVRLGIALIKQGRYAEAKTALAKATTVTGREIADFWTAYADNKMTGKTSAAATAEPVTEPTQ